MIQEKKWSDIFEPTIKTSKRYCDIPNCHQIAEYRAPKSRHQLQDYYWFCSEHIREYNKNWDYFKGMNSSQIEEELRSAAVWNKPSWKLGRLGRKHLSNEQLFTDPFDLLSQNAARKNFKSKIKPTIPAEIQKALNLLTLSWPLTLETLKKRYTNLARQYHPDTNGGDLHLEEKFKQINAAYSQLRTYLMNRIETK